MSKRIYLSSPYTHGEEMQFVKEAFDTNWLAPVGKNIDGLEAEIDAVLNRGSASGYRSLALISGTAALHLALKLAGIRPGETVFCSDSTYCATAFPVSYENGRQVFIDGERDSWNMDPEALELAFQKYPQTRIVMYAHLYGTPGKMDELLDVCKKHDAILIEDAAEALASTYHGRPCGTFGLYNAISFNGNKIITTSGGGMLVTADEGAWKKALYLATQAREPVPWFEHPDIGYNYRMSNVIAGIGRGQLLHLDEHRAMKKRIYDTYKVGFKGLPVTMNPVPDGCESNYWLSCILIDRGVDVKPMDVLDKLKTVANAEGRPLWKPMHMQPVFAGSDCVSLEEKPVGTDLYERGLCLPSDLHMDDDDMKLIIETVRSCF